MAESGDQAEDQAEQQIASIEAQIVQQLAQVANSGLQSEVAGQLAELGQAKDQEGGHVVVVECGMGQPGEQESSQLTLERHAQDQFATVGQVGGQLTAVGQVEGQLAEQVQGQLVAVDQVRGQSATVGQVEGSLSTVGQVGDQIAAVIRQDEGQLGGQVEGQLVAVTQVGGQLATIEQVEGPLESVGQDNAEITEVRQVEGQLSGTGESTLNENELVAVGQANEGHMSGEDSAEVAVVEEQMVKHILVEEHVKSHITEIETQLRQNVEVVQALQLQNTEIKDKLNKGKVTNAILQSELDGTQHEFIGYKEESKNRISSQESELLRLKLAVRALDHKLKEKTDILEQLSGAAVTTDTGNVLVAIRQIDKGKVLGQSSDEAADVEGEVVKHVVVTEFVKNHIMDIEAQLRKKIDSVEALQKSVQALHTQNAEFKDKLDSNLLQTEIDGIKKELLASREETRKAKYRISSQEKELLQSRIALKTQDHKLKEKENILEQVEAELREYVEHYEDEEAQTSSKPEPGPRIHNTRRRGNQKAKSVTPTKTETEEPAKKRPDFVPTTLRFCRTCGAKQLFKVKTEIIKLMSGKKELSSKTCAICGNSVSPPKPPSKDENQSEKDANQGETSMPKEEAVTEKRKQPSEPQTPTRPTKKRKHSETAMDVLDALADGEILDRSDKENECEDEQLALCEYPVENIPDVGASGDNDDKFSPEMVDAKIKIAEVEGVDAEAGDETDNIVLEEMDIQVDDKEGAEQDVKPVVLYPRDRKPGRPKKLVKERKKKGERTPSTAPSSGDLAPLCEANDDGSMFLDGREKHNRVMYSQMGLDPLVKSWMAEDAKELLPFKCKECPDVEFANVRPFLKHMVKHTGDKEPMSHPYKCPDCSKTFKQSRVMQQHAMSHSDDRPFKCSFCDAAFKVRSGLWRHVKIHTNPKQHLCNICGQRFQEKRKLQNHEMIHSGELPYKCQHCDEGFRRIESMRRHEKTHTGERPHVCDVCGRSFKERGDIKKHLLLHTGEKPFKCTLCSYRSNRKEYVKLHMKTHGGGTIFKCPHCEMTFSSHHACKKHEKEHFEIQVVQKDEPDESVKDGDQEQQVIPTTLIIKQGDHPHQEMLSAVDFLLQFDSANRVFAAAPGQEGTVTYVTQNPNGEDGQEPTVAYVTQGEHGQEGMVTYVAQHTTSDTGEETVTYVTEAAHPVSEGEATTVAYITEDPSTDGGDQEATITYVTQTQ